MAWDTVVTTALGEGDSTEWFDLDPKETAHVQAIRTDAGVTDGWIISAFGSTDNGTTVDTIPLISIFIAASASPPAQSFSITGVRYFRIKLFPSGGADTITCDVRVIRDGGIA
jgi:hypothetical protein